MSINLTQAATLHGQTAQNTQFPLCVDGQNGGRSVALPAAASVLFGTQSPVLTRQPQFLPPLNAASEAATAQLAPAPTTVHGGTASSTCAGSSSCSQQPPAPVPAAAAKAQGGSTGGPYALPAFNRGVRVEYHVARTRKIEGRVLDTSMVVSRDASGDSG
ncbi:hypothetical protein AURDEDRAFT_177802 [Auricularia subglabra TFB-10046 SS5]|uniref:Uncharacterized protein n=1 Tax=Auricularia subglabra (strain TFB-10046 / SS5) TaxID=717982 RepID=J0L9R5_AURST|nr:hypothetical protein AURDEDRAFT_177802 [Auricularia subglabra TFB-10046 SS5]